jgi:hypothetical protein
VSHRTLVATFVQFLTTKAPRFSRQVVLKPKATQGKSIQSDYSQAAGGYVFEGLEAGRYRIEVASRGLESETRDVEVGREDQRERFYLCKKGMLAYIRGSVRIPVEPPEGLVAVSLRPNIDEKGQEALALVLGAAVVCWRVVRCCSERARIDQTLGGTDAALLL